MIIKKVATNVILYFKLIDPSTGVPEPALTITDLDLSYVRDQAAAVKADLTEHTNITDAHADNKAKEVDGTNCPGLYRVDPPDAAFASGVDRVQLCVNGAAIDPAYIEAELVDNIEKDTYDIVSHADHGNAQLVRSTTPANKLDVSATGEAGLDFNNIKDAAGAKTLTNITVPTTTVVTNAVVTDTASRTASKADVSNLDVAVSSRSSHSVAEMVTAVFAKTGITAVGAVSFNTIVKAIYGMARGKISKAGDVYTFYDDDDTTALFVLTIAAASRTVA